MRAVTLDAVPAAPAVTEMDTPLPEIMPTIAVIGADPGVGLAIARTIGTRGFDVALVTRAKEATSEEIAPLDWACA